MAEFEKLEVCYPINLIKVILREFGPDMEFWDVNLRAFREAFSHLNEQEQKVLEHRYSELMSLDKTGAELGVSRERVRQIEARARRKLRRSLMLGYCETVSKAELELAKQRIRELEKQISRLAETPIVAEQAIDRTQVMPLEMMDLSVRTFNCLKRAGFETLGDLIRYDRFSKSFATSLKDSPWMGIRNFGRRSFEELRQRVYELSGHTIGAFLTDVKEVQS